MIGDGTDERIAYTAVMFVMDSSQTMPYLLRQGKVPAAPSLSRKAAMALNASR